MNENETVVLNNRDLSKIKFRLFLGGFLVGSVFTGAMVGLLVVA